MFQWVKNGFRKKSSLDDVLNNLSLKTDEDKILALLNYTLNNAGVKVTQKTALQVSAVFACVNVIAGTLSMLPVQVFQRRNGRRVEITNTTLSYMLRHEGFPGITAQNVFFTIIANLVLRGNGFSEIGFNGNGSVASLSPLETALVTWEERTSNWLYTPTVGDQRRIDPSRMFHIRGMSMGGGAGVDMLGIASEIIGLAMALDSNAAKFFSNGSRLGTVFESDKSLNPEARKALEQRLKEKHEGPENAHRSIILENGLKVGVDRSKNTEAQLDESRKHQIVEIARFFGVPPHKIGVQSNIPRANAEEANLAFITDTLSRYAILLENTINIQLIGTRAVRSGFYCKVNMATLLKGALKDRYQAYAVGRQWGWLSANDIRDAEDMDPIPNGDIYLEPMNMGEAGVDPIEPTLPNPDEE